MERLKNKSLYLLDMDGTIYFENELIDGAAEFLKSFDKELTATGFQRFTLRAE